MSAPSVASRSSGEQTTDSTSHPIALPAGIVAGDLLLLIVTTDENPTVTTSSPGWFKYGGTQDGGNNVCGAIFYKWATGSDACTITTTTAQQSTHICLRIPNGGVPSGTNAGGNSTNGNPPAAFTFQADDYLVIATLQTNGTVVPTAQPSGYNNMLSRTATSSATGASTTTAEKAVTISTAGGGSEDPGTWTNATDQWVCWTILIPPVIATTQYVKDSFPAGGVNPAIWTPSAATGTGVDTAGGQLNLHTAAGTGGYVSVDIANPINIRPGDIYGVKVIQFASTSQASVESYPMSIWPQGTNAVAQFLYAAGSGTWNDEFDVDGVSRTAQVSWATPPVTAIYVGVGRYLATGDLMWAYSPDGIHWRRHFSRAWPGTWDSSNMGASIVHGQYNAETSSDNMSVDDYSLWVTNTTGPTAHVRRGGATVLATATKVRRGGAWVTPTAVKVRRGGVWVTPS